MDIAGNVRQNWGGQFTKKINNYKYNRVVIVNKMLATPNSSENGEDSGDFKQKNHTQSINIYQHYLTDKIKCVTQSHN